MDFKVSKGLHVLALLLTLASPALSFADVVTMSVSPAGKGVFLLTGENVIGVQALDVEIDYDSSLLEKPYVLINGGELAQVNAGSPGKLLISVSRQVADPILQIFLNFDTKTDAVGGIYHVSAAARSTAPWPAAPDAEPPSGGAEGTPEEGHEDVVSTTKAAETVPMDLSPHVKPTVEQDKNGGIVTQAVTGASLAGIDKKTPTREIIVLMREEKSVLQRFKKFTGEKSLNSFVALFGRNDDDRVVQEPSIAISDGKTPVTIRMKVRPEESHPNAIALSDARLISKESGEQGVAIIVVPYEGTWDARLVIAAGQEILDYPLVVAPPVKIAGDINGNNFLDIINKYISAQATQQRENKAYLYEYIFTANYLATAAKAQ